MVAGAGLLSVTVPGRCSAAVAAPCVIPAVCPPWLQAQRLQDHHSPIQSLNPGKRAATGLAPMQTGRSAGSPLSNTCQDSADSELDVWADRQHASSDQDHQLAAPLQGPTWLYWE